MTDDANVPNVCFVRHAAADLVIHGIEEALAQEGFYRIVDDEPEQERERELFVAPITARFTAVWDAWGAPDADFPDGDPATSTARGISEATDADVLQLFGIGVLWGYFLYRRGLTVDKFASDPRELAALFPVDDADVSFAYRGEPTRLIAFGGSGREEDLAAALFPGEESILSFIGQLGIPPAVALSARNLSPAERGLSLRLRFAPRA